MGLLENLKEKLRLREEHEKLLIVDGKYLYFQKFTLFQRLLHVAAFTTFTWQVLTGFVLMFAYTDWAPVLYKVFGGTAGGMTIHRIMGTLMVLTYITTVNYFLLLLWANRDKIKNFFDAFKAVPGPSDKTFIHYIKYLLGFRKVPPDWDEWIWVDKFDLWAEAWGIFAMGVTGFVLWMPEVFTGFIPLPPETIPISFIVHRYEATLALGWITIVHLYMVHYGPHKFPMDWIWLSGTATEVEWLEERPKSYRRIIKSVAENQPELLEKYPFLKERYQFVLEVEKLPEEEMIERMHEYAHHLLEKEVEGRNG